MNNQNETKSIEKSETNSVYPIHYHGHIAFYNTNTEEVTNTTKELFKYYDTHSELLGIG